MPNMHKMAARLDTLAGTVHGNVYRQAFQAAAMVIRKLAVDGRHADGYRVGEPRSAKARPHRPLAKRARGRDRVLETLDAPDAYAMAEQILGAYDQLEGI